MTLRLALDENFPTPLIKAAKPWLGAIELRHLFEIDPRLPGWTIGNSSLR